LVNDRLWRLPGRATLLDAGGDVREARARERDAAAGFAPGLPAAVAREPELIEREHEAAQLRPEAADATTPARRQGRREEGAAVRRQPERRRR
jgi:hypothetical protein